MYVPTPLPLGCYTSLHFFTFFKLPPSCYSLPTSYFSSFSSYSTLCPHHLCSLLLLLILFFQCNTKLPSISFSILWFSLTFCSPSIHSKPPCLLYPFLWPSDLGVPCAFNNYGKVSPIKLHKESCAKYLVFNF